MTVSRVVSVPEIECDLVKFNVLALEGFTTDALASRRAQLKIAFGVKRPSPWTILPSAIYRDVPIQTARIHRANATISTVHSLSPRNLERSNATDLSKYKLH